MHAMRLAFFSPLNAVRRGPWASAFSGLSDHNEELLSSLAAFADIDVVVNGFEPATPWIRERFRVLGPEDFLRGRTQYTTAIYHVANNFAQHAFMVPCMRQAPGILVLHDCCLQHLVFGLTLREGDVRSLRRVLEITYGKGSSWLAAKLLLGLGDPTRLLFAKPFVEMSRGVIVYNEFARKCIFEYSPQKLVRVIPLGVPIPAEAPPARARFGFAPEHFIIASTNSLSHTKRLSLILEAIANLRIRFPQIRLLIAGGGSMGAAARKLIRKFQLESVVRESGWVSSGDYRELLRLSDIVVDLRHPYGAETAGSLARAFAAGKPAIVSAQGSFLELPDAACLKIPSGVGEERKLEEALALLIENTAVRERMGAAAREFARSTLSLENAARQYVEFVREVCASPNTASDGYFAGASATAVERFIVGSVYKLCRTSYFCRHYGVAETWRRVREEIGSR